VHIEDGQRFGLHNLRDSLSWLVNKAKVEPKTVQGIASLIVGDESELPGISGGVIGCVRGRW
jgi:hypothetical protein